MVELKGFVEKILYRKSENGYTALTLISDDESFTIVGNFPIVSEGENLLIQGEFTTHPVYGEQIKMKSYKVVEPEDELAMERYLGSGAIIGVGPKLAARIVKKFKADTFRIIEEEPERLVEIKGISERLAQTISTQIIESREVRDAMVFLEKYGIHSSLAIRVYNRFGADIYNILQTNPYRLADEISGIGFKRADEIASRIGIRVDSEFRVRSGIQYMLSLGSGQGHTYVPRNQLEERSAELLGVSIESVVLGIDNLAMEKIIFLEKDEDGQDIVYLRNFYKMEIKVANMLRDLNVSYDVDKKDLEDAINEIAKKDKIELDELQRQAVIEAVTHGVFVMSGGPGTGKTTTIRTMIELFEEEGYEIFLAAPTGRAAKRMSEACGRDARTIHRMLEVAGKVDDSNDKDGVGASTVGLFDRNEKNPLECDVVIIDETSMVDISLMCSLLRAIAPGTRLILVGDVNQLPSVGPGNVLNDIIKSGKFANITLEKIFRQAQESDIIVNAHKIHRGERVQINNKDSKDFFFLQRETASAVISEMIPLITKKLPGYVNADANDIQVLTPTRKGLLGVDNLNSVLQEQLNPASPDKKEWRGDERIFRVGDKVMQTKNNYQMEWEILGKYNIPVDKGLGVFNGDMGVIKDINDYTKTIVVEFDEGRTVNYPFKDLSEMELAYAVTVHKSQGSEYPAVVIPLLQGPQMLMNRNILYTAITRAKKCVTIVGNLNVFYEMADNTSQTRRYSGLKDRIIEQNN